jgi:hypothetical protein
VVPASGVVTDFSDFNTTTGKWGNTSGLYGADFAYAGTNATMTEAISPTNQNLHITGTLSSGAYAGAGLSFYTCADVSTFSSVSFSIAGSAPGCDLELQVQTFNQVPTTNTPPGGCVSGCYGFPSRGKVAVPTATPTVVTTALSSLSNWTAADATQVVGIQFQFTVPQVADGGTATSCTVDVTIDDVKFGS